MKKGVNKVMLVGNVTQPDVRYNQQGTAVANLALATSETWKDKNTGEQREKTEWHRIVFWGKLAEIVEKYVNKGSKLYVEGRLETREWEKDGIKRYSTEVVVNEMQMLDSKPSGQQQATGQQQSNHRPAQQQPPTNFDNFDDDIPF